MKKPPEQSSTQRNRRPFPLEGGRSQQLNLELSLATKFTIFGIQYGTNIAKSVKDSWAGAVRAVRAQARKAYARTLCLATTNTICTPMSSRENLVSGTNSPTHQGARARNDNCVHLVHLARCDLSCTCDHTTTP